jgi:hypothetical protein
MVWRNSGRFGVIVAGMRRREAPLSTVVTCAALVTCACGNMPGPFAPPMQRQPLAEFRRYRASAIVDMSDEDATAHFVRDLSSYASPPWRWAGQRPVLRVRMRSAENLRYTIDFSVQKKMLQSTGPLTVSFLVNGRVLDRVLYDRDGPQHFEKPVPEGWVTAGQDTMLGADVDKAWIPPGGGPKLGIILTRIGLTQ